MKIIMPQELRDKTGIRKSMRAFASTDIIRAFPFGEFSRRMVIDELGATYTEMCLDRALSDLEAAGVVVCARSISCRGGSMSLYRVVSDMEAWGDRSEELALARRERVSARAVSE